MPCGKKGLSVHFKLKVKNSRFKKCDRRVWLIVTFAFLKVHQSSDLGSPPASKD